MKGMCSMMGAHGVSNMCNMLHGCKMEKEEWEAELAKLSTVVQQSGDFFENAVARKGQHVAHHWIQCSTFVFHFAYIALSSP